MLQSFVDQKKVANVAAFVAKGGDVVFKKSFGWKNLEKKIPASPEDYYIMFSQTKAVATMPKRETLYPQFLSKAYQLFK